MLNTITASCAKNFSDKEKKSLRIDKHTIVLVSEDKCTEEYAEKVREKFRKSTGRASISELSSYYYCYEYNIGSLAYPLQTNVGCFLSIPILIYKHIYLNIYLYIKLFI